MIFVLTAAETAAKNHKLISTRHCTVAINDNIMPVFNQYVT